MVTSNKGLIRQWLIFARDFERIFRSANRAVNVIMSNLDLEIFARFYRFEVLKLRSYPNDELGSISWMSARTCPAKKDSELTDTKFEKLSYNFISIPFYKSYILIANVILMI